MDGKSSIVSKLSIMSKLSIVSKLNVVSRLGIVSKLGQSDHVGHLQQVENMGQVQDWWQRPKKPHRAPCCRYDFIICVYVLWAIPVDLGWVPGPEMEQIAPKK